MIFEVSEQLAAVPDFDVSTSHLIQVFNALDKAFHDPLPSIIDHLDHKEFFCRLVLLSR